MIDLDRAGMSKRNDEIYGAFEEHRLESLPTTSNADSRFETSVAAQCGKVENGECSQTLRVGS